MKPMIVISIMLLACSLQATEANAGIAKAKSGQKAEVEYWIGEIPPNWDGTDNLYVKYVLYGHPESIDTTDWGVKPPRWTHISAMVGIDTEVKEEHWSWGRGKTRSEWIDLANPKRGDKRDYEPDLAWSNRAEAECFAGDEEVEPVSFATILRDPLVVGPGITPVYGGMDIRVTLEDSTSFDGVGTAGSIDPSMRITARVAPGQIPDPEMFFETVADAIDIYDIKIRQSNSSGLIESTVTLGNDNAYFTLVFDSTPAQIASRIESAFSGKTGNYEVGTDQVLFNVTVAPADTNQIYTFGPSVEAAVPAVPVDVEIPTLSQLSLMVLVGMVLVVGITRIMRYRLRSDRSA